MTTKFQIPSHEQAPSEEMIEWLGQCAQEWEGDESGITIDDQLGGPGDWVVEEKGVYFIVLAKDMLV